jgi:hypothetical protein
LGEQGDNVRITFEFERAPIIFQIPIVLPCQDFDDTEVVEVARNMLHNIFEQLLDQCDGWRLTGDELQKLAEMNLRPGEA